MTSLHCTGGNAITVYTSSNSPIQEVFIHLKLHFFPTLEKISIT